jgi:hypothetical protein
MKLLPVCDWDESVMKNHVEQRTIHFQPAVVLLHVLKTVGWGLRGKGCAFQILA